MNLDKNETKLLELFRRIKCDTISINNSDKKLGYDSKSISDAISEMIGSRNDAFMRFLKTPRLGNGKTPMVSLMTMLSVLGTQDEEQCGNDVYASIIHGDVSGLQNILRICEIGVKEIINTLQERASSVLGHSKYVETIAVNDYGFLIDMLNVTHASVDTIADGDYRPHVFKILETLTNTLHELDKVCSYEDYIATVVK